MITKPTIAGWFARAGDLKATHMLIIRDTFSNDYHPIYVAPDQSIREQIGKYDREPNMERVEEVYNLSQDFDTQFVQYRAWNI